MAAGMKIVQDVGSPVMAWRLKRQGRKFFNIALY
jgi:hypothetical protein